MPKKSHAYLRKLGRRIMVASGATPAVAARVVDHLVDSNVVGVDSHGIMRLPDYAGWLPAGKAVGDDQIEVVREFGGTALLDAHFTYGPVTVTRAMDMATQKAGEVGVAMVSVRNTTHIGRLGEYAEQLAAGGHVGFICCTAQGAGQFVAPWGGRQPRLTTNPFAWGFPRGDGQVMVLDVATSTWPEGKVRLASRSGKPVPPGVIIDGAGSDSTNPDDLHGPPPGALLPFGRHKGYGLGLVVELLSGAISGGGCSREGMESYTHANCFFLMAARIDAFRDLADVQGDAEDLMAYVKSSLPRQVQGSVLVPYEPETMMRKQKLAEGIEIDDASWQRIADAAEQLGVGLEEGAGAKGIGPGKR